MNAPQTNAQAPAGVLADFDEAQRVLGEVYFKYQRQIGPFASQALKSVHALPKARAAVAELIEREKAQREALETCERWFMKHSPTAPLINGNGEAEHPMLTMIRATLARVQGGAE